MCLTIGQEKIRHSDISDMMSKVDIMSTIYIKFHGTSSVQYFFSVGTTVDFGSAKIIVPIEAKRNISLMHLCSTGVELSLADTSTCVIWKDGRRTCDENIVVHTTTMGCRCLISKLVRRNLDTINLERGSTPIKFVVCWVELR